MPITIEAHYDGEGFRPVGPVALPANTRVRLTFELLAVSPVPSEDDVGPIREAARPLRVQGLSDWACNLEKFPYQEWSDGEC